MLYNQSEQKPSYGATLEEVFDQVESLPEFQLMTTRKQSEVDQKIFLVPTRNDDNKSRSKKFLFRLVQALHSSGSLSFRTEETVHLVARAFNMYAVCAILPVSVSISFNTTSVMTPKHSETYIFKLNSGMDLWKLDQLCFLTKELLELNIDLYAAEKMLKKIEKQPPLYSPAMNALAMVVTSGMGALLFYGGDVDDAIVASFLGLLVFFIGQLCTMTDGLPQIQCFLSALVVSLASYFINTYIIEGQCKFAQLFGGVVWLLPGTSIVIALLEIYSQSIVYGSARLVYAISMASQLGFGIAIGCGICYPLVNMAEVFTSGCESPFPPIYKCIFVPIMSISMGVLVGCSPRHFVGIVVVSGSGVLAAIWTTALLDPPIAENVGGIVASAVVTMLSRICAHMFDQNYFIYLASGIQVLVPGGIGVRGMSDMWSGDMQGGIVFTFKMCLVGVSLVMGVFLALIPRRIWTHMNTKQHGVSRLGESRSGKMKIYREPSNASFQSEGHYYDDIVEEDLEVATNL